MSKKIFTLTILAAVAIALVLPAGLSAADDLKIRVKVERANIRQSAHADRPGHRRARPKATVFTVVEKAGDWYLIQLAGRNDRDSSTPSSSRKWSPAEDVARRGNTGRSNGGRAPAGLRRRRRGRPRATRSPCFWPGSAIFSPRIRPTRTSMRTGSSSAASSASAAKASAAGWRGITGRRRAS